MQSESFLGKPRSNSLSLELVEERAELSSKENVKVRKCSWKREARQGGRNHGAVVEAPSSILGKRDGEGDPRVLSDHCAILIEWGGDGTSHWFEKKIT